MRTTALFLVALLFAGIAFAQNYTGKELECRKSCCNSKIGEWNDAEQYCQPDSDDYDAYLEYQTCVVDCTEGRGGSCCLPMFALAGVLGLAAIRRD